MGPLAQQSHGLLAVIAALSGAAMGMLAVHLLRQPPRGPASPGHASEGTARRAGAPRHNASPSRTTQVLQLAELHLSPDNAEDPRLPGGVDTPALAARHGAAVVKLRSKALSELSLIELTERLAVALEDLRVAGAGAPWASGERAEPRSAASLQERAESGESALRHAMQKLQQMADAA